MNNILTQNDIQYVDYKDVDLLKNFVSTHGRIQKKMRVNLTSKQQRAVDVAVKRARFMALIPYVQK